MKAVAVRDLNYAYSGGRAVLSHIHFSLDEKRTLGLIGPNGAGKTTLLLCLSGLLPYTGEITIFGARLRRKNARRIRARMAFVFQNPDDQLFMPTVAEDVAFGLEGLGCSPETINTRVREALEAVGLAGFQERSAHHCSFGEKRKITLAAALARQADLMLFDEPSRELDPGGRREFLGLMKEIPGTKIIASHDLDLVLELCTDILLLREGQVIAAGEPVAILSDQTLMETNRLEVPYRLQTR